jgi:hypothetical protein
MDKRSQEVRMTADMSTSIKASRRRVARSRGALSGILLMILGAWAALVPFIGPYFDLAFTPAPNSAWHWTNGRGWLEVLPGAAAFLGGLILLFSTSRAATVFGGWLAALAGAWLVVGPSLADPLNINLGQPDPSSNSGTRALAQLLFFYAVGAAILFFASLALGRVSVLSVRDVRAAERRAEVEEAERRAAADAAIADQRARHDTDADRDGVPDREERRGAVAGPVGGTHRDGVTGREGMAARDGVAAREGMAGRDGTAGPDGAAAPGDVADRDGATSGRRRRGLFGGRHAKAETDDRVTVPPQQQGYGAQQPGYGTQQQPYNGPAQGSPQGQPPVYGPPPNEGR